ncbi:MAG TPA: M12 family metallo-peptidase [Candidatus Limnocylindrales bacterium]|nr:M12 family metallo-peptidase [Candidatus Limnocylindrales bacterium]
MHRIRFLLCISVVAATFGGIGSGAAHATPDELFSAADPPGSGAPPDVPPSVRRRFVRTNHALLDAGQDVRLNLFSDTQPVASGVVLTDHPSGLRSWSAGVEGGNRALLVVRGDGVTGLVPDGDAIYEIRPLAGGISEIRQIDRDALPPEAEPDPSAVASGAARAAQAATGTASFDAVDTIRVLIAYTPAAASASGDIEAAAQLAVDAANDAYANSAMATRIELVATAATDYVESGTIATDLSRLQGKTDGYMDELHELRNAYLADFVSLLTNDGAGYCGMAKLMATLSPSFESSAFSVVWLPCSATNWTTAHELGHNMGCQHDRANSTSSPAFTYAYGFQDPGGQFRTIMGVAEGCAGDCPRIAHFANPDVSYTGLPTGISPADPDAADCALAIDATSPVTANFRSLVEPANVAASTSRSDAVQLTFTHPWPWQFQIYRAVHGEPMAGLAVADATSYDDASATPGTSYDYWISARTELGEESAIAGPVTGMRAIPDCGNGVLEIPAEQCDDGGRLEGDGCDSACMNENALDSEAGLCVTTINDRTIGVAKAQGKENLTCLAGASAGTDSDADSCLVADAKGKVARAREKTVAADERFCLTPPEIGYAGALVAAAAAESERRSWLLDLLGDDVSAAALAKAADPVGAACQRAVAKAADRLMISYVTSFARCVKARIQDGAAFAAENLEACFDDVAADSLVMSSHIAMDATRLRQARIKSCAGMDLSAAFPGQCAAFTDTGFDACVASGAACRMCRLFDAADALARDCDLFDNAASDSSCVP